MQFGRESHLGVHDAVGGEILGALACDALSDSRVCITPTVWTNVSR